MKNFTLLFVLLITFFANSQCYTAIDAGDNFTVAIKTNGTLVAWGNNGDGQMGDGTYVNKNTPTQIGTATNWAKISVGDNHTLAIKTDGTLWGWGNNAFGKVGVTGSPIYVPTQIGTATNWQSISAGDNHSAAIKTDGTLWTWGRNFNGQLGDGTTTNVAVPTQVGSATDWKSVAAGNNYTLARRTGSTLWAWGNNSQGQLGDGTTVAKLSPVEIGAGQNTWLKIYVGTLSSMAIKSNGTLWTWGNGSQGMLGSGAQSNVIVPTQIGTATNWLTVSMGFSHALATKTDGTLWSWGWNSTGQQGNGNTTNVLVPTYTSTTNVSLIAAGYYHSICTITSGSGLIYSWGDNLDGQIGNGTTSSNGVPVAPTSISCPTTLSNEVFANNLLSVYPNPSNRNFTVNTKENINKIAAYDMLGKEIMLQSFSSNEFSIETTGIYLLKIELANNTIINQKIIIN